MLSRTIFMDSPKQIPDKFFKLIELKINALFSSAIGMNEWMKEWTLKTFKIRVTPTIMYYLNTRIVGIIGKVQFLSASKYYRFGGSTVEI